MRRFNGVLVPIFGECKAEQQPEPAGQQAKPVTTCLQMKR